MLKLGYLGPVGSFSHQAAELWPGQFELMPFRPISQVLEAFENHLVDRAIVPLENLIEDVVTLTIDRLIASNGSLRITGELFLPIRQMLLGKPGSELSRIRRVASHLQGLGQCRNFLGQHGLEVVEVASTALAAQMVAEGSDEALAAIASAKAAEIYGLKILASDIGDSKLNITRFVFLGGPAPNRTGDDKTTIFFTTKDLPGALHRALGVFDYAGVNLSKIASRTAKTRMGECVFWVDAEAHSEDDSLKVALGQLKGRFATSVIIAGSYPKAKLPTTEKE